VDVTVEVRRATDDDVPAILALARRTLDWSGGDEDERFFRWKHLENPFGASPMWVAEVGDAVVGFRTFMRWELARRDGSHLRAVRAVDTATDPDHLGRGIFRHLTLHGLRALAADDVALVFNTPNAKSLPGYLQMGWEVAGRPLVGVMPSGPGSWWQLAGARVPASLVPIEMHVGERPADVLVDDDALARLVGRSAPTDGLTTRRTPAYLRWRYGNEALRYRIVLASTSVEDGFAVFHLRRRGRAVEATVCDVLVPGGDRDVGRDLMRRIADLTRADYLLRVDGRRRAPGFVPLPGTGPVVTFRTLDGRAGPEWRDVAFTMGDLELF
jgi:hypothetical protein